MRKHEPCVVVDSISCRAPAEWPPHRKLPTCFRCGQPVCVNCSLRVMYLTYGRQRLCHLCLDELDDALPRDQRRAHRHLLRLAGYPA